MANNLTGVERFFCSSWDGWEGDLECVNFYDIEPNQLLIKIQEPNTVQLAVFLTLNPTVKGCR